MQSFPKELAQANSSVWEWDPSGWDWPFTLLRFVKIDWFMGGQEDMNFVKFMLLNSPALQSMTIKVDESFSGGTYSTTENEMLKKMLRFKRASREAEINVR